MPLDSIPQNERPLPAAVDIERVVLGAVLIDNGLFSRCTQLTTSDFVGDFHRGVFAAMLELDEERRPIDPVLIGEILNARRGEFFGNVSAVGELTDGIPFELNIDQYVAEIRDASARRQAIAKMDRLSSALAAKKISLKNFAIELAAVENDLRDSRAEETDSFKTLAEVFQTDVLPTLEAYYKGESSQFLIPTGFPQIDKVLGGGLYLSDFLAVVAPPKSAKSAFALQLALNIAEAGETVGLLSLEMSNLQNGLRFIAQKSYSDSIKKTGTPVDAVSASWLRPGIYQSSYEAACRTAASLFDTKLLLCQKPLEWRELQAETRRLVREKNMRVLVVDYWQLVFNSKKGQTRADSLAEIAKGLKQLAQELNICVVALGQFNQEGLKHKASGGELNAQLYLEGSGELVKSANIVLTIEIEDANLNSPVLPRKGKLTFKPLRSAADARLDCHFFGRYLTLEID